MPAARTATAPPNAEAKPSPACNPQPPAEAQVPRRRAAANNFAPSGRRARARAQQPHERNC
eukprot:1846038-Alexandrium_andersonii.AAC.1